MNEADREDVYQQACIGFMQVVLYQQFPVANLAATVKGQYVKVSKTIFKIKRRQSQFRVLLPMLSFA